MHSQRLLLVLLPLSATAVQRSKGKALIRRQTLLIVLLTVGVALDLIVSLALGYVAVEAHRNATQARIIKLAAYEFCIKANEDKQADLKRWDEVLVLVRDGNADPKVTQFIQGVQKANQTADSPADCNRIQP